MSTLSTHVLDTARGRPATGLAVELARRDGARWTTLDRGRTDDDGRVGALGVDGLVERGDHRLTFATGAWFAAQGVDGFYPEASVVFTVADPDAHYHVPLLLSPYGYSTYRGS